MILLGVLAFGLATAPSATDTELPLSRLVALVEPYVKCRADTDRRIVVLQQQVQSKQLESREYNIQSDPVYQELKDLNFRVKQECDLPKYVSLVGAAWGKSDRYHDWQRQKLAEIFIADVIQVQWSFLNSQGVYQFPKVIVNGTKN